MMSLGWILEEVSKLLEVNGGKSCNFVVDIMPNLRFLIKADIFLADCSEEIKKFENKVTGTIKYFGVIYCRRFKIYCIMLFDVNITIFLIQSK